MKGEAQFSLGFMKPSRFFSFGHAGDFGSPGAGGSLGYADPAAVIGYTYITNRMGVPLTGDPRDVALRQALQGDHARSVMTAGRKANTGARLTR